MFTRATPSTRLSYLRTLFCLQKKWRSGKFTKWIGDTSEAKQVSACSSEFSTLTAVSHTDTSSATKIIMLGMKIDRIGIEITTIDGIKLFQVLVSSDPTRTSLNSKMTCNTNHKTIIAEMMVITSSKSPMIQVLTSKIKDSAQMVNRTNNNKRITRIITLKDSLTTTSTPCISSSASNHPSITTDLSMPQDKLTLVECLQIRT